MLPQQNMGMPSLELCGPPCRYGSEAQGMVTRSLLLTSFTPYLPATHCESSLSLAGHTLLGLDIISVVGHHKGAHGGAAAPTVPLDQGQLREHTTAAGHNTAHLDKVAQMPRPAEEGTKRGKSAAGL
jgi:hypothetical protein